MPVFHLYHTILSREVNLQNAIKTTKQNNVHNIVTKINQDISSKFTFF